MDEYGNGSIKVKVITVNFSILGQIGLAIKYKPELDQDLFHLRLSDALQNLSSPVFRTMWVIILDAPMFRMFTVFPAVNPNHPAHLLICIQ